MTANSDELNRYFKAVSRSLRCGGKQKNPVLIDLKENVLDYVKQNPSASMAQIYDEFGTPDEISSSFAESHERGKRYGIQIRNAIIAAIVIMVLIYAAFAVTSLIDVHREAYGRIEEGFLTIISLGAWSI